MAYDGTRYFGWQKARFRATIQGELESACHAIFQEEVLAEAASRTDRGVHARGQIVQILCNKEMVLEKLILALNGKLPSDIRVLGAERTSLDFHVTLDSLAKTYVYNIDLGAARDPFRSKFSWHHPKKLDVEKMRTSARDIVGERNFGAFTTQRGDIKKDQVRDLYKIHILQQEPHFLRIALTGNSFLYKMARRVVGTLADIGAGKIDSSRLSHLFEGKDRSLAGVTAPAHGLILQRIYYSKEKLLEDILSSHD